MHTSIVVLCNLNLLPTISSIDSRFRGSQMRAQAYLLGTLCDQIHSYLSQGVKNVDVMRLLNSTPGLHLHADLYHTYINNPGST